MKGPCLAVHTKKKKALEAFVVSGTITAACEVAGIHRSTWYDWLEADEEFRACALDLKEANTDELEEEAIRRAKRGSDTLLIFLLKSRRPGVYRDRPTIDVVSPEVTSRLQQQADAILEICPPQIAPKLAARLREIWVHSARDSKRLTRPKCEADSSRPENATEHPHKPNALAF